MSHSPSPGLMIFFRWSTQASVIFAACLSMPISSSSLIMRTLVHLVSAGEKRDASRLLFMLRYTEKRRGVLFEKELLRSGLFQNEFQRIQKIVLLENEFD